MIRLLAVVWVPTDRGSALAAGRLIESAKLSGIGTGRDFQEAHSSDRMWLAACGAEAKRWELTILPHGAGVVVGCVFRRNAEPRGLENASGLAVSSISGSGGASLFQDYWGRYVAFVRDAPGCRSFVLRDPSGMLPLYSSEVQGAFVYFTHMADFARLQPQLSLDWSYLSRRLHFNRLRARETGFREIREVLPGEQVEHAHRLTRRRFLWDPVSIAAAASETKIDDPRGVLRSVLSEVTAAWASCHDRIVHKLSGGLDSSIVLGALSRCRSAPEIVCINFVTGTEGDERRYARLAASRANCELVEIVRGERDYDLRRALQSAHDVRPELNAIARESDDIDAAFSGSRGIQACFAGRGGDNVFYKDMQGLCPSDFFLDHGPVRAGWTVLYDTAHLTQRSVWSVLAQTARHVLRGRASTASAYYASAARFTPDAEAAADAPDCVPPWFTATDWKLPPAKLRQVVGIVDCQNYHRATHGVDQLYPLVSQPLLELSLALPCYRLAFGGRDRALARDAFADEVPPEILRRKRKGHMSGLVHATVVAQLPFIRELLLDGRLAAEGALDRAKLERGLQPSVLLRDPMIFMTLVEHAAVEAWIQSWEARARIRRDNSPASCEVSSSPEPGRVQHALR
jgi:asparagine synthase (glutamine-hydrolysing)